MRKFLIAAILALVPISLHGQVFTPAPVNPCFSNTPISSTFQNITTATTTALVAPSGTTKVYVCWVSIGSTSTTSANTVLIEQGTSAACATGPTAMTATYNMGIAAAAIATVNLGTLAPTGAGGGVCAVSTVGSTPAINVTIGFIQQ